MINSTPQISKVNIRFSDLDLFGHVNNAVYLTYYEEARVSYFDEVVGYDYDWSKEGVILARIEVDFLIPILFTHRSLLFSIFIWTDISAFHSQNEERVSTIHIK